MEAEMFVQQEACRSDVYKLLAGFYYPPNEELSGKVDDLVEKLGQVFPHAHQAIDRSVQQNLNSVTLKDLHVEFARLFVGPYELLAPPFGSVYLEDEKRIMGDSTLDVVKRYATVGLKIDDAFKNPPDHVAAELEFMHVLITEELKSLSSGDAERTIECLEQQLDFLECHLGQWIDAFAGLIVQEAQLDYYRYLVIATQQFIREDLRRLGETLSTWFTQAETSSSNYSQLGQNA